MQPAGKASRPCTLPLAVTSAHDHARYDAVDRLLAREELITATLMEHEYLANGQVSRIVHGDSREPPGPFGMPERRYAYDLSYDQRGWLGGAVHYLYETNVPTANPPVSTYSFAHDDARRLTHAKLVREGGHLLQPKRSYERSYLYATDDDWNLSGIIDHVSGVATGFTYDAEFQDQLLQRVDDDGVSQEVRRFAYSDALGGLEASWLDGQPNDRSYAWTVGDRLASADVSGVNTKYAYDPMGRLIAQRTGAGPTVIRLWDGWSRLGEYHDGATDRAMSFTPEGLGTAGEMASGGAFEHHATDFQASRKDLGSADLPVFSPFGQLVEGSLDSSIGFQGQEWHPESELYQMRHRWYDAEAHRMLSRDPVVQSTLSSYALVHGRPVTHFDPMGLRDEYRTSSAMQEALIATHVGLLSGPNEPGFSAWRAPDGTAALIPGSYATPASIRLFGPSSPVGQALLDAGYEFHGCVHGHPSGKDWPSIPRDFWAHESDHAALVQRFGPDVTPVDAYIVTPNGEVVRYNFPLADGTSQIGTVATIGDIHALGTGGAP